MKPQEVRIGNLVYDTNGHVNHVNLEAMTYLCKEPHNQVKPIPLTEEWLVKFGFENSDETYFRKEITNDKDGYQALELMLDYDGKIYLQLVFLIDDDEENEDFFFRGDILEYVHQLQNLYFALTGTELEIK